MKTPVEFYKEKAQECLDKAHNSDNALVKQKYMKARGYYLELLAEVKEK